MDVEQAIFWDSILRQVKDSGAVPYVDRTAYYYPILNQISTAGYVNMIKDGRGYIAGCTITPAGIIFIKQGGYFGRLSRNERWAYKKRLRKEALKRVVMSLPWKRIRITIEVLALIATPLTFIFFLYDRWC